MVARAMSRPRLPLAVDGIHDEVQLCVGCAECERRALAYPASLKARLKEPPGFVPRGFVRRRR